MIRILTNCRSDRVEQSLTSNEEEGTENKITYRPSVLQGVENQEELHNNIDEEKQRIQNVEHNEENSSVLRAETSPALESDQTDSEIDDKHA